MQACRTTISGTALVSAALAAAFVLASGPAASPRTAARPLVTGPAARTVAPSEIEAVKGFWSQLSGGKGSTTISARALGIEAYRPHAARGGRVRVVIESGSPALARAAVVASGGRVERTNSGEVGVLEEIKLHGKVVARLKPVWFSTAVRARTVRSGGRCRRAPAGRTSTASGRSIVQGTRRHGAARESAQSER